MVTDRVLLAIAILVQSSCAQNFPEDPTLEELDEMHRIMSDCLSEIVPLEKDFSRTCRNVEDALIAYYGGLSAFLEAQKAYK